nr:hypothetical protein [Tanacetum cinerariifolium]
MDQTGEVVVTTTAVATITTLVVTTGIPVMGVTREIGVSSPTDLPILAKNFQWGLHRSTLNHLMCMSYTDVAQVSNVARNYEILHERDDDDTERPDKRQKSGDRHQPTSQQSSHRNHGHNNDRHGSDRRGSQQSRGPSEGYSYPVCTTCGHRHPGECHRAAGTYFKYGQAGHLQKDCKKNTTASTSGLADKKPGASGRVFAITEGHAANTSAGATTKVTKDDDLRFGG